MFHVVQLFIYVFVFGRIVHRTIRIRPYSMKPLFGTSLFRLFLLSTDNMIRTAAAVRIRDLRSFEIRFESAVRLENFQIKSAVPAPLLVVSLAKRLKPLKALSGTVYRLASSVSDHTPVV